MLARHDGRARELAGHEGVKGVVFAHNGDAEMSLQDTMGMHVKLHDTIGMGCGYVIARRDGDGMKMGELPYVQREDDELIKCMSRRNDEEVMTPEGYEGYGDKSEI